ncbi:DUF87 domain-containing protein [Patescibacteria group bacterium]|nr:DUF87 domain-containing protein [Patescibacteria group bacterium]
MSNSTLGNLELFEPNRLGRLMKIEENEYTRYQFEIWFEYTRQSMMELKEGTLLAAKNFDSNGDESHYSILELISIKPVHYALGDNIDGYPGFVMEAAKNISSDWITQESESTEDTTIIKCIATPTEIEIIQSDSECSIKVDKSIPMIGTAIKVVTGDVTEKIINKGIPFESGLIFEGGKWLVNEKIPIFLTTDEFLRVHFGIFGFTKAGKSNLLSTLISKMLQSSKFGNPVKIVIFDLMSEFNVLLADQLDMFKNGRLVAIGEKTYPDSVIQYLTGHDGFKNKAINDLVFSSLYPQELEKSKLKFEQIVGSMFDNHAIRVLHESQIKLEDLVNNNRDILTRGSTGNSGRFIKAFINNLYKHGDKNISIVLLNDIITSIDTLLKEQTNHVYLSGIVLTDKGLTQTAEDNLRNFRGILLQMFKTLQRQSSYLDHAMITTDDIVDDLNDENESSLYVIQSHDPDSLREFAYELGNNLFENRRMNGTLSPLVSFIFDEADEFIPQQAEKDSSYYKSVSIAHMLARRGRKFGIGIGIATQRTRYLNTSIMAQPHTYLVSKLPRKMDRDVVQEAFGFSEEVFKQTFKFTKGDWLLASYDATGLTGVPIPIHAENANERIMKYLEKMDDDL